MKLRDEQIEAMGTALGLDFEARLAECLRRLPAPGVEDADTVVAFCLAAGGIYDLGTEREIALFALALSAKRGGFRHAVRLDAQTILRDGRMDIGQRLDRLIDWSGATKETVAAFADDFGDKPAAGVIAKKEKAAGGESLVIELVDEADWGVEGEEYRVEFANGVRAHGRLDAAGKAVISGIDDPGVCQVTFPHLDQAVWERIS